MFKIVIYSIEADGRTKDVCWNKYRSEWLGQAYTTAWANKLGKKIIGSVVCKGYSRNFTA